MLLWECVEAYSELDEQQQGVYKELLQTDQYKEIETMAVTTFEKGMAAGLAKGREQARRETARLFLEHRFGALPAPVLDRLDAWPAERLEELLLAVIDAKSLRELGLED